MTTLREPLVHAGCLVLQVENLIGSYGVATYRTVGIQKGGYKTIALARLAIIYGELRVHLKHSIHRGTNGHITEADIRSVINQHVTMNTTEAPEVLIFEIGAVAVFIHLDGYLVFTFPDIGGDVEFGRFHRALAITNPLTIYPDIEGRHHTLEAQKGLTRLPTSGQGEGTTILSCGVSFLVGGPLLLGLLHYIGRINLKRIAC